MKNAYETVPSIDTGEEGEEDEDDDDDDGFGNDTRSRRPRRQSVTLGTLATGGNRTIDLKACYVRAMEARHLSTDEVFVTIDPQEIELITTIGEGSFGTVWTGIWRNNSVAVKEFGFAQSAIHGDSQQSESLVEEIIGEAGLMTCLRHPKILQLYGCSLTPQAVWIVCELCERGSLRMLLDDTKHTPLSNELKLSLCLDVADGMQYLHRRKKPIIHRDLKSYNIFIIENPPGKYTAKIGDWGSARAIALSGSPRSMTQGVGTACWLAPEAIKQVSGSEGTKQEVLDCLIA
jgi:serine/threonine protein kinase